MSRIVRKQLLSLCGSIQETHRLLPDMLSDGQKEAAAGLLADCQESAIAIGSQIEEVYEGKEEIVCGLERYCETLYHMAEHLGDAKARGDYWEQAQRQISDIREKIEQDIPNRLEIAFFSYKLSWWDCLESIYLEAFKDERCEAYCIPVPYYERKEDKNQGEWHDEREEYPAYIRTTDWRKYEFEIRKPDIIFIDNPYDGWTEEEGTEERFYASNLRTYTEMLVYVPHFLWEDIKAGGKKGAEALKRFCFLPGTIHADKIIVESEDMRMAYINEYKWQVGSRGVEIDQETLEHKIVALGSPKTDKPEIRQRPAADLPKEWSSLLTKPDGGRKKVIYYYTGINGMLMEEEKLLDKTESVLAAMKKRRDEAVLWWRPQPQIGLMLESMRPELWEKYSAIVERYQEEGWGIYDDTKEGERAIAVMDGYYGDWSTVVWECQKSGKPALIQNADVRNDGEDGKARYRILSFTDAWKEGDTLWVSNGTFNGIFKIDMADGRGEWIRRFDRETGYQKLHQQILEDKGRLIFIPNRASQAAFFNKKTHAIEYVRIAASEKEKEEIVIKGACLYKDELWLFPEKLEQNVRIIDVKSRCVRYDDTLEKAVKKAKKQAEDAFFGKACIRENEVWLPIRKSPDILRYDIGTGETEFIRLKASKAGIKSMDMLKDTFWLTCWDTAEIIEWSPMTDKEEHYRMETPLRGIVPVADSQCIGIPAYEDGLFLQKGSVCRKLDFPDGFAWMSGDGPKKTEDYGYRHEEGKIFIFSSSWNMFLVYDVRTEELDGKVCRVPEEWSGGRILEEHIYPYYMPANLERGKEAYEEWEDDLSVFLHCVEKEEKREKKITHNGEKIYRYFVDDTEKEEG